jgi:hypothetical protein
VIDKWNEISLQRVRRSLKINFRFNFILIFYLIEMVDYNPNRGNFGIFDLYAHYKCKLSYSSVASLPAYLRSFE